MSAREENPGWVCYKLSKVGDVGVCTLHNVEPHFTDVTTSTNGLDTSHQTYPERYASNSFFQQAIRQTLGRLPT